MAIAVNIEKNHSMDTNQLITNDIDESFKYDFSGEMYDSDWKVKTVTDDPDGDCDTGHEIDWAPDDFDGIYSKVRDDEDLDDEYWIQGAWCVGAAEWGPVFGTETTKGYTTLTSPSFKISDFDKGIDTNNEYFGLDDVNLYFDWQIYSDDFSNTDNSEYVKISSITLKKVGGSLSLDIKKEELKWTPEDLDYPDGGNGESRSANDYAASGSSFTNALNDNLDAEFYIVIRLDCKLYAGAYNLEKFKFWLDDIKIKGKYFYNCNMPPRMGEVSIPRWVVLGGTAGFGISGATDPENDDCRLHVSIWKEGEETNKWEKNSGYSKDYFGKDVTFRLDEEEYPSGTVIIYRMWVEDIHEAESSAYQDDFHIAKPSKSKTTLSLNHMFLENYPNLYSLLQRLLQRLPTFR
jgi:hypothetical protein